MCRVIAARKDNFVGTHIGWGPHDCTVITTLPLKVSASECVRANGYKSSGVNVSRLTFRSLCYACDSAGERVFS